MTITANSTARDRMSLRELARRAGCTIKAIRYYERKGLISPAHQTGRRRYDETTRTRLRLVMALRDLGFSAVDISALFPGHASPDSPVGSTPPNPSTPADAARRLVAGLNTAIAQASERISALERARADLIQAAGELTVCTGCARSIDACHVCTTSGVLGDAASSLLIPTATPPKHSV